MGIKVKIRTDWDNGSLEVDLPITEECFKADRNYVCVENGSVEIVGMFNQCKAIPDVDRYRARKKGNSICLDEHDLSEICDSKYKDKHVNSDDCASSTIVLLLESPHKNEYKIIIL